MKRVNIFVPDNSQGILTHASILESAIEKIGLGAGIMRVPSFVYRNSAEENDRLVKLDNIGDIAIFVERLFEHPILHQYSRRICLINPEWFQPSDAKRANILTEFWHTSLFSHQNLSTAFPDITHTYLGFTSIDPMLRVAEYDTFVHCRGKSLHRNSQYILNNWLRNPQWPKLKLQAYGGDPFVESNNGMRSVNVDFHFDFMEQKEYDACISSGGVHLCTSEVEAFGHYINEARALGALTVILDAPPMNELIDKDSGVLIPVVGQKKENFGVRFQTSEAHIYNTLSQVMKMDEAHKRNLGMRARERFEKEGALFMSRLTANLTP